MTVEKELARIFVLNVKSLHERRKFMRQQLARFQLEAEFILDGDIEDFNDGLLATYFAGDQLSPAQRSCAIKHVYALRQIAAGGAEFNLVLEDDAVFAPDFKLGIRRAIEQSHLFPGLKVIYIGSGGNFFTPKSQRRAGQYLYPGTRARFADSYILDAATAQKRLNWIAARKISEPIDNLFQKMDAELGIQTIWLEDPVVEQGSKNGLFDSALERGRPRWLQRLAFAWEKLRRKRIYQLWR